MALTNDTNKFWMNDWLEAEVDVVNNEAIPNKWDCLTLIFGMEGSGKTVFAGQLAWKLKPKYSRLTMDNVVFSPPQFDEAIEKLPEESVIIWDEAITGAMSAKGASAMALAIIQKLTMIRKKRLKMILCFPYIDILNRFYINRCLFAVKVTANDFNDRGYFAFYSQPRIEKVHFLAKMQYKFNQYMAWKKQNPNFEGRFGEFFPFDEQEYEAKKDAARSWQEEGDARLSTSDRYMGKILKKIQEGKLEGMSIPKFARLMGIADTMLYKILEKYNNAEKTLDNTDSIKGLSRQRKGITPNKYELYLDMEQQKPDLEVENDEFS